jgi:dipeptidyl aminopeptidase/acylaminoacyl peptidase
VKTRRVALIFLPTLVLAGLAVVLSAPTAESAFPGGNGKIAYSCFAPATRSSEICVVNADGSERGFMTNTGLAFDVLHEVTPAWSADGGRLAFVRSSNDTVDPGVGPFGAVFVLRANRTGLKLINNPNFPDNDPAWYPDGRRLLFGSPLKIGMADGSSLEVFGRSRGQPPLQGGDWAVSPDGARIAFNHNEAIAVMNSDGSGFRDLFFVGCCASRPDWSPDGTRLVFSMIRLSVDRSYDVWVKDVDRATPPVRLFRTDEVDESAPVWSPDGGSIAYSAKRTGDSVSRIEVAAADGSGRRAITSGPLDFFPDWQPCPGRCASVRSMGELRPLPAPTVTLAAARRVVSFPGVVTLSGRTSWDQGHSVDVRGKTCRRRSAPVLHVETQEGGTFRSRTPLDQSTTFVASWNSQQGNPYAQGGTVASRTVKIKVRPRVLLTRSGSSRYSVGVLASMSLAGRRVVLEQKHGRWLKSAQATLRRRGAGPIPNSILSAATFQVQAPAGTPLRASLPASQAAPCYAASRSKVLRAG